MNDEKGRRQTGSVTGGSSSEMGPVVGNRYPELVGEGEGGSVMWGRGRRR